MNTIRLGLLVSVLLACPLPASAQVRISGAVSGLVTDASGAVVPGASVLLKDADTGVRKETVSNEAGAFQFPDLNFGVYELTVTLQGFQTAVISKVVVESSRTTDVRVKLTVGAVGETITVEGAAPVLETSSNVISSTLTRKDVTELPLAGRNAFTFARLVPGAVAPAGTGSTHYNGMPGGTINPTIDGVNNSSNGFKSGGTSFFGTVRARLGAVEEVTVESAGLGGDAGVEGRCQPQVRHPPRHQPVPRQRLRAGAQRHLQRQHLLQYLARHSQGRAPPPRLRRQLRRPARALRQLAREALPVRELRAGIHPAHPDPLADHPDDRGPAGHLPLHHLGRRAANRQPVAGRAERRIPLDAGSGAGGAPRAAKRRPGARRQQPDDEPAHRNAVVGAAAEADQLLSDRAHRLSDLAEPVVDGQLESLSPGRPGPAQLAVPRLSNPARHVPQFVVDYVDRPQLDAGQEHLQRVPLRRAASGDTTSGGNTKTTS